VFFEFKQPVEIATYLDLEGMEGMMEGKATMINLQDLFIELTYSPISL
jgi:hypothetical protein